MNIVPEVKACETCAKSKRKCGKERPRCHRCSSRDMECIYPPARPSSFVLLRDDPETPASCDTSTTLDNTRGFWDPNVLFCSLPELDVSPSAYNADLHLIKPASIQPKSQNCDWFMAPETWKPTFASPPPCERADTQWTPPYANAILKRYLRGLQRRLYAWVSTGGTDFLHRHLYRFRNPRCVQDAQGALALYMARNDENEDAVFRTINDRARQLLEDEERGPAHAGRLDVVGHLARVHALMTYQIIGLLDGDIHLRATAEARREVLSAWLGQMIECVRTASTFYCGGVDDDLALLANGLGIGMKGALMDGQALFPAVREEIVWHAWILAESLRRTWITGHGLLITYHALQTGWATCEGSMKMTAGQGMWDAPSSYAWAKVARETKVFFMDGTATERLFLEANANEVDSFTKGLMEMSHGPERVERWEIAATA